jgi:hypothetical protein
MKYQWICTVYGDQACRRADEGTYIVVNGNEVSVDMYSTSHCSSTACAAETYVNKTSWKAQAMVV